MPRIDPYPELSILGAALEACRKLKDPGGRQQIVEELPDPISSRIQHHDDARSHILSIVRASIEIPGGIDLLLERLGAFENATTAWPDVERAARALKAKLATGAPAAAMTPVELAESQAPSGDQRNLALVIGISQYQDGGEPNRELRPEQFTNLAFAADDAKAIHRVLQQHAGYTVLPLLLNEAATRRGILRALDDVRKACQGDDQTVVVYFSGHGATDADSRHYLVPHDAHRDDLFATALWSREFEQVLQEIPSKRLVVFLDACHAGAIGAPSTKDADFVRFDPEGLKSMTIDRGRFMVASCQARQKSLEIDGHGIFTQHLLELLQCDDPRIFPDVAVDLFDLYAVLRSKVTQTASDRFSGARQEPFANFIKTTGVVIRVQTQRKERYLGALLDCLFAQPGQTPRVLHRRPLRIKLRLTDYVRGTGERVPALSEFYRLFDENLNVTDPADLAAVEVDCRDLVRTFSQAMGDAAAPASGSPWGSIPSRPSDASERAAKPQAASELGLGAMPVPDAAAGARVLGGSIAAAPPLASKGDRRALERSDADYILEEAIDARVFRELRELRDKLTQADGVTVQEITEWLEKKVRADVPEWEPMKDRIAIRFMERVRNAPKVQRQSAVDLRTSRG